MTTAKLSVRGESMAEDKKHDRPVKVVRYGGVKASVWRNASEKGEFYSVSVVRSYKDQAGEWQESMTFRQNDLPKLEKAASEAYRWILQEAGKED